MDKIDWRRMPPLSALRAFEAAARLGGFSAAGRALNVTHAAIAQQVRGLEDHLGRTLLSRDGRRLSLTQEGAHLSLALTEAFGAVQTAIDDLSASDASRPLSVTITPSFAVQWLMPRLGRFWDKYPDITVALNPDHRVLDLRRERIDIGIRFGMGHWPGVESEFLISARYMVVAAPPLLGGRKDLTVEEMMALPWVREKDWPEHQQWMESIGLDPTRMDFTDFPNEELALSAARQGFGLHVESAALVADDIAAGRLVKVFDREDDVLAYYIVATPGPRRDCARAFVSWLKTEV